MRMCVYAYVCMFALGESKVYKGDEAGMQQFKSCSFQNTTWF